MPCSALQCTAPHCNTQKENAFCACCFKQFRPRNLRSVALFPHPFSLSPPPPPFPLSLSQTRSLATYVSIHIRLTTNCRECVPAAHGISGQIWQQGCGARRHWYTLHIATHCNALQHTATHSTHCNTLQRTAAHMQHTATHCHALPRTAIRYNTLQRTATHCNTLTQQN